MRNIIIAFARVATDDCTIAPGTHLCQFRVLLYFNPPALIFSQVPVKGIEFMQGEIINILFNKGNGQKMTAYIQVHTPVFKSGCIFHTYMGDIQPGARQF